VIHASVELVFYTFEHFEYESSDTIKFLLTIYWNKFP